MLRVFVISSHPDDETLGCAGTIAKHIANGDEVHCIVMASNYRSPQIADDFQKVMLVLGVKHYKLFGLPDMELEKYTMRELSKLIEQYIEEVGVPDVVYTHWEKDLSQDHRLTFLATITALRPVWNKSFFIYSFESPSSTEWSGHPFDAEMFVDVKDFMDKKMEALKCYKTEIQLFPHPRSKESLMGRAIYWGSYCGLEYAEAFKVVREVR